jgi:hypothetical protein
MRGIGQILEDYEKGNFDRRLNLYLLYRDLRHELSDIESKEKSMTLKVTRANEHQKRRYNLPFYKWSFALLRNLTGV